MKAIGIIGSRRRDTAIDYKVTEKCFITIYEEGDIIVSGGCKKGGDRFAELIAAKFNLTEANGRLKLFRAEWSKYGRPAGFIRNTVIAKVSDVLIACVAPDRRGGTEDTIKKFEAIHPENKVLLV